MQCFISRVSFPSLQTRQNNDFPSDAAECRQAASTSLTRKKIKCFQAELSPVRPFSSKCALDTFVERPLGLKLTLPKLASEPSKSVRMLLNVCQSEALIVRPPFIPWLFLRFAWGMRTNEAACLCQFSWRAERASKRVWDWPEDQRRGNFKCKWILFSILGILPQ